MRTGRGLGFRLAGAPTEEVEPAQAAERFKALTADRSLGVIAVDQALLEHVPQALLERTKRDGVPVLLPIALPERWQEAGQGEAYVAALIRRAIGYHVKIQR
jgi:V/A-type H+-transporting ATPase subunit F